MNENNYEERGRQLFIADEDVVKYISLREQGYTDDEAYRRVLLSIYRSL